MKRLQYVLKTTPDDVESLRAAGAALRMLGAPDEARGHWMRTLELEPKNELILLDLVAPEPSTGRLRAGLAFVDGLIKRNPWRAGVYARKADMLSRLQRLQGGVEAAKKALERNSSTPAVHDWPFQTDRVRGKTQESRHLDTMRKRLTPTP
jgi:tetratricopeptide (TPR) repeat protein